MNPIKTPAVNPTTEHNQASTGVLVTDPNPIILSGRARAAARYKAGIKKTVERINYHFKAD